MNANRAVVAIVDDDLAVCRALCRLVTAMGREAQFFSSGNALLYGSDAERSYDILLDYHMPGLAGPRLVARVRTRWPEARIIVMSGLEMPDAAEACLAAGADWFLLKPVCPADLEFHLDNEGGKEGGASM